MKYKGEHIKAPSSEIVAFPRDEIVDGQVVHNDLVFTISPVLDFSEFDAVCPEPMPKAMIRQGGERGFDYENPDYMKQRSEWYALRINWMCIKSLSSSELEWETVNLQDPSTFANFRTELHDAFLTDTQITHLINKILGINGIDEARMQEARNRFLALKGAQKNHNSSSRNSEHGTITSGTVV